VGLKLEVHFPPNFQQPSVAKLSIRCKKSFQSARIVQTSSSTMRNMIGLRLCAPGVAKNFDVFLPVTLLNGRGCANDLAINALEYGNAFQHTVG